MIRERRFLTLAEVTHLADVAAGTGVEIRDLGVLVCALERPRARIGDRWVYGDLHEQAGALLHALVTTRPFRLVDHEGVALMAALAMLHVNGERAQGPDAEDALRLTARVGRGLDDVSVIAAHLRRLVAGEPWQDVLPEV